MLVVMALAIEMRSYGPPDVLRPVDRPDPAPGPGEVVVRTVCAAVNRADLFIRCGEWPVRAGLPYVPGLEVCGTVAAVGDGVRGFAAGDTVITMMQRLGGIHGVRPGGYQTHVVVPADTLVRVPAALDALTAGSYGLAAVTAYLAIQALEVPGDARVLVHAGSSGVGSLAVQMLAAANNTVVATGTRPAKFDFVRAAGAEDVVDTRDPAWPERVGRVDRVFDLVGRATFAASVGLLEPGGRLVFVGGTSGGELALSGWDLMKPVTITGYSTETLTREELALAVEAIAFMHQRGALRPTRVTEFPLAEAAAAHRAMEAGDLEGRVLLRA
jgi:NADPH2:quinone reductase